MLLILMGKTCSGKDTVVKELTSKYGYHRIVTTTSRPMRKGEQQHIDYNFISKDKFMQKIDEGYFVEYKSYQTPNGEWYYGTSYESLENIEADKNYVIILTPDGYRDFSKTVSIPHKSIYIYANNKTIIKRLKKRMDKNDSPQRRLEHDNEDFKGVETEVDKIIYNNDGADIDDATNKILEYLNGNK